MDNSFENKAWSGSRRVVVALASCVFSATLILLAIQMGPKPQDKTGTAEEDSSREAKPNKPKPA